MRQSSDTYNSDAVERGRAGYPPPRIFQGEAQFVERSRPWAQFRIGAGPDSWNNDPAKRRQQPDGLFPAKAWD